jgi:hypothetical protein
MEGKKVLVRSYFNTLSLIWFSFRIRENKTQVRRRGMMDFVKVSVCLMRPKAKKVNDGLLTTRSDGRIKIVVNVGPEGTTGDVTTKKTYTKSW